MSCNGELSKFLRIFSVISSSHREMLDNLTEASSVCKCGIPFHFTERYLSDSPWNEWMGNFPRKLWLYDFSNELFFLFVNKKPNSSLFKINFPQICYIWPTHECNIAKKQSCIIHIFIFMYFSYVVTSMYSIKLKLSRL